MFQLYVPHLPPFSMLSVQESAYHCVQPAENHTNPDCGLATSIQSRWKASIKSVWGTTRRAVKVDWRGYMLTVEAFLPRILSSENFIRLGVVLIYRLAKALRYASQQSLQLSPGGNQYGHKTLAWQSENEAPLISSPTYVRSGGPRCNALHP